MTWHVRSHARCRWVMMGGRGRAWECCQLPFMEVRGKRWEGVRGWVASSWMVVVVRCGSHVSHTVMITVGGGNSQLCGFRLIQLE